MPKRDPEVTLVRFLRNEEFGEPHLYAEEIDRDLEAGTVTYQVTFPLFGRERSQGLFGRERSQGESFGQAAGEALEAVIVTPEPDLTVVDDELAAAIDEEMPDLPEVD